jgi:hypothetical protein
LAGLGLVIGRKPLQMANAHLASCARPLVTAAGLARTRADADPGYRQDVVHLVESVRLFVSTCERYVPYVFPARVCLPGTRGLARDVAGVSWARSIAVRPCPVNTDSSSGILGHLVVSDGEPVDGPAVGNRDGELHSPASVSSVPVLRT